MLIAWLALCPRVVAGDAWVVETSDERAIRWIEAEGCTITARASAALQVDCAGTAASRLGEAPGAARVRPPSWATPKDVGEAGTGATTSEGYAETFGTVDWHAEGVTGRHVEVAVLDVGFAGWEELVGTELPARTTTDFTWGNAESSTHGLAVAEVIHDFAPDARLRLVSFSTDVEFAAAVEALVADHVDVINGSIGFDNTWPADGTSLASRAVDAARDAGVIYVAAAGNETGKYVIGDLSRGLDAVRLDGHARHPLASRSGYVGVSFRWSEPFGAASVDLDLVLYDTTGVECASSESTQDGRGDPVESISTASCDGEEVIAAIVAKDPAQDVSGLTGWLYALNGVDPAEAAAADTLTLPADADGAFSVGAWTDDGLPSWTSRGPTDDGRLKPDVVGPTGVTTTTLGEGAFDGTSASAPHAAGLAALWLDATHRWGDPEGFRSWAQDGATDLGPGGSDTGWGAGALHADAIPDRACGCAAAPIQGSLSLGWIVVGYACRRRSCSSRC